MDISIIEGDGRLKAKASHSSSFYFSAHFLKTRAHFRLQKLDYWRDIICQFNSVNIYSGGESSESKSLS